MRRSARRGGRAGRQRLGRRRRAICRPHTDHRLRRIPRSIGVFRNALQVWLHRVAEHGERDRRPALKQCAAELPLERDDGVGQRGLRDAAASGRSREIALLTERQEVTDLLHLHVTPPVSFGSRARLPSASGLEGEALHIRRIFLVDPKLGGRRADAL
jgi:hypothetical protein